MGRVKIPYYVVKQGKSGPTGYFQPTPKMKQSGFVSQCLGPDCPTAWAAAQALVEKWHNTATEPERKCGRQLLRGSLAEAFARYQETPEWGAKAPRTREEWERAWSRINPIFGDVAPSTVTLAHLSTFRETIEARVSTREAHRCLKVWRALWRVAAALGYCQRDADPSLGVRNREPERRQAVWTYNDASSLVKVAWRTGYRGLAAIIAVAWDTSLSPVDVRSLTPALRVKDDQGEAFLLARAKTGRAAAATLTRRSSKVLDAYLAGLGAEVAPLAPIFRNRSGHPYSKDTLGDDFRAVRSLAFGGEERRTLADFRRSGAVEALRGGASAEQVGTKLANDFASSAALQKTYAPVDLATVRKADAARRLGRNKNG
jgi:hypothetical protein